MRSASPRIRPSGCRWYRLPLLRVAVIGACLALIGGAAAGCETTQDKAAKQQARATHILKARAERQQAKKKQKTAREGEAAPPKGEKK